LVDLERWIWGKRLRDERLVRAGITAEGSRAARAAM